MVFGQPFPRMFYLKRAGRFVSFHPFIYTPVCPFVGREVKVLGRRITGHRSQRSEHSTFIMRMECPGNSPNVLDRIQSQSKRTCQSEFLEFTNLTSLLLSIFLYVLWFLYPQVRVSKCHRLLLGLLGRVLLVLNDTSTQSTSDSSPSGSRRFREET